MTYEKIVESVKKSLAKANASKANPVAIQIDIVGEGEGAFYVKVNDGTLAIEPYEYYDHDAKLIISGKDCVDLFNGKLDAEKAYKAGKISVEGNLDSVLKLKDLIPAKPAAAKKPAAKKATAKKTTAKKTTAKKATAKKPAAKAEAPKAEVKAAEKPAAPKATVKKAAGTTAAKKTTAKKPATAAAKNTTVKKAAETTAAKTTTAKKPAAKKPVTAKKTSTAKNTK